MLASPRTLITALVAAVLLGVAPAAASGAALQPRQSAGPTTTTCTYTFSCDTANGYKRANTDPGAMSYRRCVRAPSDSPDNAISDCYYPNRGGNTSTGEPTAQDTSVAGTDGVCPQYLIVSDQASSCQTTRRRAINTGPDWVKSRQAVVKRDKDGKKSVVPQKKEKADKMEKVVKPSE